MSYSPNDNELLDKELENVLGELLKPHVDHLTGSFVAPEEMEPIDPNSDLNYGEIIDEQLYYDDDIRDFVFQDNVCPVCAVDVGATKIGDTSDGALVAFRGKAIFHSS
ncbi:hypothetical protein DNHGIG_39370 [Collibacillus ludicampi]|uniref:Uncharacterized protein n=1 Tax=Collibacillus ludicampi TaxID=2771369 RepID=A0AAV4LLH6_9BACL|nr:hypothetical protein [Collibacillus ludicampi]GIM48388.1 hypothetical protein DNHGIG_39370 [Collibacillus ludicampi]